MIALSIDPGISSGYVVWQNGDWVKFDHIKPPANLSPEQKINFVLDRYHMVFDLVSDLGRIDKIVVEKWAEHYVLGRKRAMFLAHEARGAIRGLAYLACTDVALVGKGKRSKEEAREYAESIGIHSKIHDIWDAALLGHLAGLDTW